MATEIFTKIKGDLQLMSGVNPELENVSNTPETIEYDVTAELKQDGDTFEVGIHLGIEDKVLADQLCSDVSSKIIGATVVSALAVGNDALLKF
jgi:hypothetical protein